MRRRAALRLLMTSACLIATTGVASAAPGDLDPSFGKHGIARVDALTPGMLLEDGGVLHQVCCNGYEDGQVVLSVTASNGRTDTSFGENGKARVPGLDNLTALTTGASGRILAGGTVQRSDGTDLVLARFLPTGTLDPSFGVGGEKAYDVGPGLNWPSGLAVTPAGRILIGASTQAGAAVIGLEGDGDEDSSFATAGRLDLGSGSGVQIAADGRGWYLVARTANELPYGDSIVVTRINGEGTVDGTYGESGTADSKSGLMDSFSLAVGPAGRVAVGGTYSSFLGSHIGTVYSPVLAVLTAGGQPDPNFDTGPATSLGEPEQSDQRLLGLAWDEDGRLVVSGALLEGTPMPPLETPYIARFRDDGRLDTAFGQGGIGVFPTDFSTFPGTFIDAQLVRPAGEILGLSGSSLVQFLPGGVGADADADGVRDRRDLCPRRYGRRADGCQIARMSLTARYERRRIRGTIAGFRGCLETMSSNGRKVRIHRRQRGRDPVVAAPRIRGIRFRARLRPRGHRYFVTLAKRHLPDTVDCSRARSKLVP